ncbi:hypothetical protein [Actinomadura hibisca]|uniref:hypothetical protein n=1 Tax=Actinomadura hibisca TaxID=68565 RepID=UPI00082BAD53|nr:hypothetical protein [Actinomadura hibisca]
MTLAELPALPDDVLLVTEVDPADPAPDALVQACARLLDRHRTPAPGTPPSITLVRGGDGSSSA